MFLHSRQVAAGTRPLPHLSRILDGLLYPLWDIGLKIGHSVRSIEDCVKIANSDMQSKTSLIEARLITGDEELFKRFQKTLVSKCVAGHEQEYIAMRLADQAARRAKFGNSACMQEPNLKNGCGGLRDFQNLLWMAFFKYRTRSLKELQAHDLISESERKQLETAYDFLLRVRTEMHYHVNRPLDVLSKNLQPAVALNLGYRERSPSKRIEEFMRDVYTHSRNIFLITRTLEQRLALLPSRAGCSGFSLPGRLSRPAPRRTQARRRTRGRLQVHRRGNPRHLQPRLPRPAAPPDARVPLRAAARAAPAPRPGAAHPQPARPGGPRVPVRRARARKLPGHPRPARQRRAHPARHARGGFARQVPARVRQAHLPGAARVLPPIHRRRAHPDVPRATGPHLGGQSAALLHLHPAVPEARAALRALPGPAPPRRRQGRRPRQPLRGKRDLALRAAKRLNLDDAATQTLRLVIEHHLLMASVSQRRDLDDPAVIRQFAKQGADTRKPWPCSRSTPLWMPRPPATSSGTASRTCCSARCTTRPCN